MNKSIATEHSNERRGGDTCTEGRLQLMSVLFNGFLLFVVSIPPSASLKKLPPLSPPPRFLSSSSAYIELVAASFFVVCCCCYVATLLQYTHSHTYEHTCYLKYKKQATRTGCKLKEGKCKDQIGEACFFVSSSPISKIVLQNLHGCGTTFEVYLLFLLHVRNSHPL